MKFLVKNVGKVNHAQIDVQGITVIAGYNDTGKTTVLRSADVILKTYSALSENIGEERIKSIAQMLQKQHGLFRGSDFEAWPLSFLVLFAADIVNDMKKRNAKMIRWETFYDIFCRDFDLYTEERAFYQRYDNKEEEAEIKETAKKIYHKIEEICERPDAVYLKYLAEINLRKVFCQQASNLLNEDVSEIGAIDLRGFSRIVFQSGKVIETTGNELGSNPVVYIETSNVLDGFSKGNNGSLSELREWIQKERSFNREKLSLEQYQETETNLDTLDEIFRQVLHGRLQAESNAVMYKDDFLAEPIHIANVASGMKIFLIFRRLIENGTLSENGWVLIDEPESNLHPDWHLKLAEILVLMNLKMNIHILLSSHSPYFIRALEIKMADYGIKDSGRFYLMEAEGNLFCARDVTEHTEDIYRQLYKPLELL